MNAITEDLWREVHEHIASFERLARRTLEEAWQAGDKLILLKQQTPHGQWLPSLKERGVSVHLAERMMRLRRRYPEILQIAEFDSVQAALNAKKTKPAQKKVRRSPYLVSADDLWDWERGEPTPLAYRFLSEEELTEFSHAVLGAEKQYAQGYGSHKELGIALALFRLAFSCYVDIGPLKDNPAAMTETERRFDAFESSRVDWIEKPDLFLRMSLRASDRVRGLEGPPRARLAALNGYNKEERDGADWDTPFFQIVRTGE